MRNVTLRGLLAHKLRLALTSLAIVLGVTFITGAFVLTDTLHRTLYSMTASADEKIDFQARGDAQLSTTGTNAVRNPIPESLLATIGAIPGVATVAGQVAGYTQSISPQGQAMTDGSGGTVGVNFAADTEVGTLRLAEGKAPTTADDVVMDAATAHKYHFTVGQHVEVLSALAPRTFTVSGIADLGPSADLAGTTVAAFTLPTAQSLIGEVGQLDDINVVTKPGADGAMVRRDVNRLLPRGVQVVTGRTVATEERTAIDQSLTVFSEALLIFALISLFVGGFTILNTFSITVGQRTRELAILRILGASRRQIFASVLSEAAIVGAASSVTGLGLGVAAAIGLEALLRSFAITLPTGPLAVEPRTVVVALAVGTGVTIVAAINPARRAVSVPAVAAITGRPTDTGPATRRRLLWGTITATLGASLVAGGLAAGSIALVGAGAASVFIGTAMLAPAVARPFAGGIGWPLAHLAGTAGNLGQRNAMRNPQRTAHTAAALIVGVALVAAMAVFGASLSRSATASVDQAVRANLLITASSGGLPPSAPDIAAAVPGVTLTTAVYRDQFEFEGSVATLTAVPPAALAATVNVQMNAGDTAALAHNQLLIDSTTAHRAHLAVGDLVAVDFAQTGPTSLRIGGIYRANALIGSYLVSKTYYLEHFPNSQIGALLLATNGTNGVDQHVRNALAVYPNLTIQTRAQFEKAQTASVNRLLGLLFALLTLAGIIAIIGIVNTLLLSVIERTHEIGLLRAVGMKRRQVRTMIRSESVIVAAFGAIVGIVIGTGLGIALVASLRSKGITDTIVPTTSLLAFLVIAALLGLAASIWPARRAAKLNVLTAIAAD